MLLHRTFPTCARREPEKTVVCRIVSPHLESFLRYTRDHDRRHLPGYVELELGRFLRCGVLRCGQASLRCAHCGRDVLMAHACKRRAHHKIATCTVGWRDQPHRTQLVALIAGKYNLQTLEHIAARVALLELIMEQDARVAEARKLRRPVPDVDPNPGEPPVTPTEPTTPAEPVNPG
jgi:hypothetical protein